MRNSGLSWVFALPLVLALPATAKPDKSLTESKPLVIDGKSDLTISGLRITNPNGNGITVKNSKNIRIENCEIGPCKGEAVSIYACDDVVVTKNRFEHIRTGVYALDSEGIQVSHNKCRNVQGPFPRGQMVQFDKVSGKGNRINFNICENVLGKSYAEDAVNLYKSNGTADDPIQVIGNKIRGGGPSGSGGGIMTGDAGGSYILVKDNTLVDPGQYGIAIASGHHIQILNNKVYGKKQPFTNVGIYVWNQYKPACHSHTVKGNEVRWYNKKGAENPCWNGNNCGPIKGWGENNWHADLDAHILPKDLMGNSIGPRKEE